MKSLLNSKIGIFIVLLILCFFSCSSKKNKAGYSEGHIVYKVNMEQFNSSLSFLCPESFDLVYSNKGFAFKSSFMMGLMDAKVMHDYSTDVVNMIMGVPGSGKYTSYDVDKISESMKGVALKKVNMKIKVLGYDCKCMEYNNSKKNVNLRIYYSDSFNSKISTRFFPKLGIDGMILKVEIKSKEGKMNIVAQEFSDEKILTSLFHIPETYSKTSMEEIMSIIRDMSK